MRIPTTKTPISAGRRFRRSFGGSPGRDSASHPSAMRISWSEAERSGHRPPSRSPGASSSWRDAAITRYRPRWVILTRCGARRDWFPGDRTTSSTSYTSTGDQISVSLELVEPPETSVLTLHWPQGPGPLESNHSYPRVVAADGLVVLFEMTLADDKFPNDLIDYFVYKANVYPYQQPSLLRLPTFYRKKDCYGRRPEQHILIRDATGVLSYREDRFIVAELQTRKDSESEVDIYMFLSGSKEWILFKRLHVHRNNGGCGLLGWSTDAVFPFGHGFLIWVDYRIGMIVAEMDITTHQEKPRLEYIPMPQDDLVRGIPGGWSYGRGFPKASRSLGVTSSGIKFVTVDVKHSCSFGEGSTFRITLWSLDISFKWSIVATLDAEELWALDSEKRFPHVPPEFPVINMENPDSVCFLLNEDCYTANSSHTIWMIEVNLKKKA